jgi:hypothetical protein
MRREAEEMMRTYLGNDADGLDGFEFLVMAEAGEAGHWEVLGKISENGGEEDIRELVSWALPIQERHFRTARKLALHLGAEEEPCEGESAQGFWSIGRVGEGPTAGRGKGLLDLFLISRGYDPAMAVRAPMRG